MLGKTWWSLGVIGVLLCLSTRAPAQDLKFFYCYAPDPARNTVFVSPVMPIGPVEERRRYGDEFVAHLMKQGRLRAPVQGYCSMKPSAEQVATAQAKLPVETCLECGGAANFAPVAWPRAGRPSPPVATGLGAARPATAKGSSIEILDFDEPAKPQSFLVILGNTGTGKVVVLKQPSSAAADAVERRYAGKDGWKRLLITGGPGHGAAACAGVDGRIEFFVVHEQASEAEAQLRARQFALQSVDDPLAINLCHLGWDAGSPGDDPSLLDAGFDAVKQRVREAVTCAAGDAACEDRNHKTPTSMGVRG
ncbi:hypothetical protein MNQ95_07295 [Pseudoxanthomonas daejeonensis]|uniref:hypothetical protein n=1 Tax=Pseudoxanthomonas daejeonensis TaxID=266062 RepID=UPI001F542166|nr:hypothetical protein [Pseudoxanthomonas daejeonensis]UNK58871.1 hypothetical protein MNQ95_07295 [Pseudoxanthomonas daejeonensis]